MRCDSQQWDIKGVSAVSQLVLQKKIMPRFLDRLRCSHCLRKSEYEQVVTALVAAYNVTEPNYEIYKSKQYCGMYDFQSNTLVLKNYTHLKTVLHEFYHHLDNETNGLYDSDDKRGGSSSLAWQFAEHFMEQLMKEVKDGKSNPC